MWEWMAISCREIQNMKWDITYIRGMSTLLLSSTVRDGWVLPAFAATKHNNANLVRRRACCSLVFHYFSSFTLGFTTITTRKMHTHFSEMLISFQGVSQAWSTMWDKYRWENNGTDPASYEGTKPLHIWSCLWACVCGVAEERLLSTLPSLWAVQDFTGQCPPAITEEEVRQDINHTGLDSSLV